MAWSAWPRIDGPAGGAGNGRVFGLGSEISPRLARIVGVQMELIRTCRSGL